MSSSPTTSPSHEAPRGQTTRIALASVSVRSPAQCCSQWTRTLTAVTLLTVPTATGSLRTSAWQLSVRGMRRSHIEKDSSRTHESVRAQFEASSPTQLSANVEPNRLEGKHCGAGHMATARVSAYPRGVPRVDAQGVGEHGLADDGRPGMDAHLARELGPRVVVAL